MRASILLWSTMSGVVLGVFVDATLIGAALLFSAVIPALASRVQHRWVSIAAMVLLAVIPVAFAVLGFLEGQLKAS